MARRLRRRLFLGVAGACVATLAACVASDFAEGQFACNPHGDSACPPGLLCASDGRCRIRDVDGGPLGPSPEGAADAPNRTTDGAVVDDANDAANPCESAVWTTLVDGRAPAALALTPEGRLYAGGQANTTQGWLAEIDTCDGGIVAESLFDVPGGATKPSVSSVIPVNSGLAFCGGADAPNAVFGLFAATTTPTSRTTIAGNGFSGLSRSAVASDGAVWHSGGKLYFSSMSTGWVVRTVAGAETCQLTTAATSVALAPGPAGSMYVTQNGATSSQVVLVNAQCGTGATVGAPLMVGAKASGVSTLIAAPGFLYAAGTASGTAPNTYAFLSALDLSTGKWATTTLDPNPTEADLVQVAASDTHALYLGVNERAGFGTGRPTFYRYDPPFVAGSMFAAVGLPFSAVEIAVRDIVVAPFGTDGVYVAAATLQDTGGITRCRKSGECAK